MNLALEQSRRAGCILLRKSRESGTVAGVYRADEAGIDGGKWATVCEDHGTILTTDTREQAVYAAAHTASFCDDCRGAS